MTDVTALWIVGLACLIAALIGKAVTIGNVQLPETAEKKARAGLAVVGSIALVLGCALFIRPNGDQQPAQTAATTQPVRTPSSSNPASSTTPAAVASPTGISAPPSTPHTPSTTLKPLYLDTLTGTTNQDDTQAAAPESGSWQLGTQAYPHSLGYSADLNLCDLSQSVTYAIPGGYQFLVATVGVSDTPTDTSGQGVAVSFEVDDGSGNQLGSQSAQYGQSEAIRVDIQANTTLTLVTASTRGCFGSGSTEAVWGDAQLIS